MGKIVAKFGGSSLSDAGQFRKVRNILQMDERRCYVVPSAPGRRFDGDEKITDLLYRSYRLKQQGQDFMQAFAPIRERFIGIARELSLKLDIAADLDEIERNLLAGASEDYCASRGEYLNGLLLADYLDFDFLDPKDFIFFAPDGSFDSERTHTTLAAILATVDRAVIPGFYGVDAAGGIHTFSRGGSDISGAIVARAAYADIYENWTDVDGFLMADPRMVEDAKAIRNITYRELRELSYMGATVLHEDSVFPVHRAGIPTN
ncbi:MAG: aspartate kinase, partial [Clostridia bacterium]